MSLQGDKGPRFTGTFGIMGFFKPPRLPFDERPKLVTQDDLEQFKQQAGASLLALNRLQDLDLSACPKITDSSITQVDEQHLELGHTTARNQRPAVTAVVLSSGGALPGPPAPLSVHADGDHRRQLGVSRPPLSQPHQPGAQLLSRHQRLRRGTSCAVSLQTAASLPFLLR